MNRQYYSCLEILIYLFSFHKQAKRCFLFKWLIGSILISVQQCQSFLHPHNWIVFWCLKSSEHNNLKIKNLNKKLNSVVFFYFIYVNMKRLDIRYKTSHFVLSLMLIPKKSYLVSSLWFFFICACKCASIKKAFSH